MLFSLKIAVRRREGAIRQSSRCFSQVVASLVFPSFVCHSARRRFLASPFNHLSSLLTQSKCQTISNIVRLSPHQPGTSGKRENVQVFPVARTAVFPCVCSFAIYPTFRHPSESSPFIYTAGAALRLTHSELAGAAALTACWRVQFLI